MIQPKDTRPLKVLIYQFIYWNRIFRRFKVYAAFDFSRFSRVNLCINGPPTLLFFTSSKSSGFDFFPFTLGTNLQDSLATTSHNLSKNFSLALLHFMDSE